MPVHPDFSVRNPDPDTLGLISERWSPRAWHGDVPSEATLRTVFDAARWAPSCYNEQPWRFVSCNESSHAEFLACLVEANRAWAKAAPVLGFVVARRHFARNGKPNEHALFDAGAAWMCLALQASSMGLQAHGMAGVDFDAAARLLRIDNENEKIICAFALGSPDLSAPVEITGRKSLEDCWQVLG